MAIRQIGTLVAAVGVFGCTAAAADGQDARARRADSLFVRYGDDTPGLSIRVLEKGEVVLSGEYGLASLEHEIPISASTVFAIGSNSKQFTGFAIALLAAEGVIELDEDVRTYVPEVPDFGHTITIRHLLHHTSGIRDWVRPFVMAGYDASDAIPLEEVMQFLAQQESLNFTPGERYMYSNTGYVLLAQVVARATGVSFPDWMQAHVFEPIGMTRTRVRKSPYDVVKGIATSYYPSGDEYLNVRNGLAAYGSCCVLTSTDDLVKWLRNFETRKVGGDAVIQTMLADTVAIDEWDGRLVGYGYGLMHFRYRGLRGLFHSGQWVGFRSATLQVPERHLSIVVLGNMGPSGNLKEWDVLDIYAGDVIDPDEAAPVDGFTETLDAMAVPIDEETLERYAGTYDVGTADGSSEVLTVRREGDRLSIQFTTDREPSSWTPVSETEFMSRPDGPTLGFEAAEAGPATAAVWRGVPYPRTEPFSPDVEAMRELTGVYYSGELDTGWRFDLSDETQLVATQMRWGEVMAFTPTVKDEFRGRSQITRAHFERDPTGEVTAVLISGRRALDVRFVKLGDARLARAAGSDPAR